MKNLLLLADRFLCKLKMTMGFILNILFKLWVICFVFLAKYITIKKKILSSILRGLFMEKINVVQYGCGKMSKYTMRYVFEKGARIVGAFDIAENVIGKDIGEIIEDGKKYKVLVDDAKNLEAFLNGHEVDCVVVTTMSLLADCEDVLLTCAKCGVNAITTCEEAFYPQNSNPKLFKKIDELAQLNECTICGSGYQDVFWGNLISVLAGATHKITKIKGKSSYNVEDYGIALAKAHGAGLSLEEFDEQVASVDRISDEERQAMIDRGEYLPSYMWNVNGWLCDKLGLTVKRQTQKKYILKDKSIDDNMRIKPSGNGFFFKTTSRSRLVTHYDYNSVTKKSRRKRSFKYY